MALNFKGVPYTTTWLEYPDIAGALQEKGVAPNASGTPYTAPAAQFEDGTIVMDSLRIARELERRHPEPSLVVDDAVVEQALTVMNNIFGACVAELLPPVPRAFLSDVSAEYFETSREKAFGMTLAELQKAKGGQQAWDAATPFIQEMAALLRKKGDGPFYLGNTGMCCSSCLLLLQIVCLYHADVGVCACVQYRLPTLLPPACPSS